MQKWHILFFCEIHFTPSLVRRTSNSATTIYRYATTQEQMLPLYSNGLLILDNNPQKKKKLLQHFSFLRRPRLSSEAAYQYATGQEHYPCPIEILADNNPQENNSTFNKPLLFARACCFQMHLHMTRTRSISKMTYYYSNIIDVH